MRKSFVLALVAVVWGSNSFAKLHWPNLHCGRVIGAIDHARYCPKDSTPTPADPRFFAISTQDYDISFSSDLTLDGNQVEYKFEKYSNEESTKQGEENQETKDAFAEQVANNPTLRSLWVS